ncbi:replication-relaxation family protein [Gryllotalpicola reticulitermitis]|uniref:Replication-relaxation family protein n=1 Tax=Gryllotalpicola reticulitermitis TaxID=1184153 RepID=A0ABV8QAE8_9MICO
MNKYSAHYRGLSWQHSLERLTPRDLLVLDDLERFRLLTTRQIQRLRFPVAASAVDGHASQGAATKATMRTLSRLRDDKVVTPLEVRRGGIRSGSQGLVWQLSETGRRIQQERTGRGSPHRFMEPGSMFVSHILGVADLAISVLELERGGRIEVLSVEAEPANWRTFLGAHLKTVTVKPDLTLVSAVVGSDFEDHWFIELDRATEHVSSKVMAKCRTYAAYAATGAEQAERGVFPRVLWVVPDSRRRAAVAGAIAVERDLPAHYFQVCTTDEFASVIAGQGSTDDAA